MLRRIIPFSLFVMILKSHTMCKLLSIAKAIPLQAWTCPWCLIKFRLPEFLGRHHMKVVRLSALHTGRLYSPVHIPGTHLCYRLSRTQVHSAAGRIMSIKNLNYHTGNRYRDVPACSALPQYGVMYYVTFKVLTKIIIFWDVTQFNPVH